MVIASSGNLPHCHSIVLLHLLLVPLWLIKFSLTSSTTSIFVKIQKQPVFKVWNLWEKGRAKSDP